MEIDYDLKACLDNNPQGFDIGNIKEVLAVREGVNDEEDWVWVLKIQAPGATERYVMVRGWCDYTGWDCQSSASSEWHFRLDSLKGKLSNEIEINMMVLSQIDKGKAETWREKMDKEFGITSGEESEECK